MAQHIITLNPIDDCAFDYSYPNWVKNIGNTIGYDSTYMKFDLSALSGKTIESIKLKIFPIYDTSQFEKYLRYKWQNIASLSTITVGNFDMITEGLLSGTPVMDGITSATFTLNNGSILNSDNTLLCRFYLSNGNNTEFYSTRTAAKPQLIIVYSDTIPNSPKPLYPIGQYVDVSQDIPFSWQYSSPLGDSQSKFDLMYSTNNGVSWTTITQSTANNYYNLSANTLVSGNIKWKVQAYNSFNEASGYSDEVSFYAVGAPAAPNIISITTDTAKPSISWSALQQEVYQVQVLHDNNIVYDTGNQPYKIYAHKVPVFLEDGSYTVKARVQNEYGLWSSWAESLFTVSTVKPNKPVAIFQTIRNGVEALVTSTADVEYYLLLRNDIPVHRTTGSRLYDYTAEHGKEYQYMVRAVTNADTYADSDIRLMQTSVKGNVFAPASDLSNILELRYNLNKKPDKSFRCGVIINSMLCAGRKYAILDKSEHSEYSVSFVFFTKNISDIDKLNQLVEDNNTVLYRDNRGGKIFGSIVSFDSVELKNGWQVSFTLNASDYVEGVYD